MNLADVFPRAVDLSAQPSQGSEPRASRLLAGLIILGLALFAITHTAPLDLRGQNEDRVAAYVQDILDNGHWWCQHDAEGDVASKPPMFMWLAALATLVNGRLGPSSLYFPSILANFGLGLILFAAGRALFGWRAGWWAGLTFLLSHVGEHQMLTARYDPLFSLTVFLTALAALRAWELGRRWTWFWLAGAASTLTKGPLGLVLGGAGLLAAFWEGGWRKPSAIRGSHLLGVGLFLLVVGGWLVLAWRQVGDALFKTMLFGELIRHAVGDSSEAAGIGFYKPLLAFLGDFAPWSVVTMLALWRTCRRPSALPEDRRRERFLACAFLAGLVIFSLAAHQRARLVLPLMPLGALLAGREIARWTERLTARRIMAASAGLAVVGLAIISVHQHVWKTGRRGTRETAGIRQVARQIEQDLGRSYPIVHLNSPFALRYFLDTTPPFTSLAALSQLRESGLPIVVAVGDPAQLSRDPPGAWHELARWPQTGECIVAVLSNRKTLERTDPLAWQFGPLQVRLTEVHLLRVTGRRFELEPAGDGARIELRTGLDAETATIQITSSSDGRGQRAQVRRDQSWKANIVGRTTIELRDRDR